YTVGAFYQHARTGFTQQVVEPDMDALSQSLFGVPIIDVIGIGLLPGGISYEQTSAALEEQAAGFGEIGYKLTPALEITGGVRVAHVKVTSQFNADGLYNGGPTDPALTGIQRSSETPVNPKGSLSYHFNDDNLMYVTASRGFRSGGPNTPVPA